MSTIKISQLPQFSVINSNTANTLFVGVDIPSAQTFQFSAGTLAEGLYANTALIVGNNRIVYDNTVAQFSSLANNYVQLNLQNFANGIYSSADFVASTIDSDNLTKYIDMGIGNPLYNDPVNYSAFKPYDGYLYVYGASSTSAQGNLILGTASANARIQFIVGGTMSENIVAWMTNTGLKLNTQSSITFSDGTIQSTAAASNAYSQAAFVTANSSYNKANSGSSYANASFAVANSGSSYANAGFNQANASFAVANTSLQNTATVIVVGLTATTANITTINTANTVVNNGIVTTANVQSNYLLANVAYIGNTTINNGITLGDAALYQYNTSNNTTVTQLTSKSTAVTTNGRTGQITTSNASLAKGAAVSFTVNNSQIVSAKDIVMVSIASGGTLSSYQICVDAVAPGSFSICITNNGTGALAEALVINYAILRVN